MLLEYPLKINKKVFLNTLIPDALDSYYLNWLNDPVVNNFLEVRHNPPNRLDEVKDYVKNINESSNSLLIGIYSVDNNLHIGNLKLGPVDWNNLVSNLGFVIGEKAYWGKGYASDAIKRTIEYAFTDLGLAKVTAGCYAENKGSQLALLKAGFKNEGCLSSQWLTKNGRQDGLLFGCVNPKQKNSQTRN